MSSRREQEIIGAFVDLSDELVDDYDIVALLSQLTSTCAHLLDVSSAGLLLADENGVLHLMASSSQRVQHLEVIQLQRREGPCLDAYREQRAVSVPNVEAAHARWPLFCEAARVVGFASAHALPMRIRDTVLGSLGLFGERSGTLPDDDVVLAQALAHVASVAIVNARTVSDGETVNGQLRHALGSRIAIEQAKGVLAHAGSLDMDTAFSMLRRYARDVSRKLSAVSDEIVRRELSTAEVLDHARSLGLLSEAD